MDELKKKMKGMMKKAAPSGSKFKGTGHVLGGKEPQARRWRVRGCCARS